MKFISILDTDDDEILICLDKVVAVSFIKAHADDLDDLPYYRTTIVFAHSEADIKCNLTMDWRSYLTTALKGELT